MPCTPADVPVAQVLPTRPTANPHLSHSIWTFNGLERQRIVHFALLLSLVSSSTLPYPLPLTHIYTFFCTEITKREKNRADKI